MNTVNGEAKTDSNGSPEDDSNDAYDALTRPVCAFITFNSDDGYEEALKYTRRNWFQRQLASYRGEEEDGVDSQLLG